jgi:hypothetical protein
MSPCPNSPPGTPGSLSTYRQYTFYNTDVDIGIETFIQTVVIYGTDVETV